MPTGFCYCTYGGNYIEIVYISHQPPQKRVVRRKVKENRLFFRFQYVTRRSLITKKLTEIVALVSLFLCKFFQLTAIHYTFVECESVVSMPQGGGLHPF